MKACPTCGNYNFNNAYECNKCKYKFDDVIICENCGESNLKIWEKCIKCGKRINITNNHKNNGYEYKNNNSEKKQENNVKTTLFECTVCKNKFSIDTRDNFDAFACKKCKSIFSYEWIKNKLIINVIKKEQIIPNEIMNLANFFSLEFPITQNDLKKSYHKILSQYHPDKVSHLAQEFKNISEQKTKEIIKNYELLNNWININN